jgi:endonuclease III
MRHTRSRANPGHVTTAPPAAEAPVPAAPPAAATVAGTNRAVVKATAARKPVPRSKLKGPEIAVLFERLAAERPEPRTELAYGNPFTLIVAVLLSAQATDLGVNKATTGLFALADTPAKMLELGEDRVREAIRTIGLFRTKSRNVIELSRLLIERHGGAVPADRDALQALPGVGRKTANVVLNEAFGVPTIAVDTHIFRVANRTGLAPGKDPLAVETLLERVVPERFKRGAHHWLILHGRYVCKARKPECWRCTIADICRFEPKTAAPAPLPPR